MAVVRRACDLDLLIFFVRHPTTMMTSEQLAAFVGYDLSQISRSLEVLLEARLLARTQSPAHAARLYEFTPARTGGGWLPAFVRLASTRTGRIALKVALHSGVPEPNRRTTRAVAPLGAPRIARIGDRRRA
jgi:hypothetical protein